MIGACFMLHNMLLHYVAHEHEEGGEDVHEQDDEEPNGANDG